MAEISRFRVSPADAQVEIRDDADVDRPRWESGKEQVLYSPQYVVLATRDDIEGPVEFEVRVGGDAADEVVGCLLFDGELFTTGHGILVGSSLTELHRIALPIGCHPMRIYADRPTEPARFIVLFDGPHAGA
jgi:hypothetical protein